MGDTPEWAEKRACQLAREAGMPFDVGCTPHGPYTGPLIAAFARYIAAHEEEPVDPLFDAMRAIGYGAENAVAELREELTKRGLKIVEADHAS